MIRRTEIGEPPGCRAAMQARRHWLRSVAAGVAVLALGPGRGLAAEPALPALEVFRSPSCGCCGAWIAHMEAAGFAVQARMVADTAAALASQGSQIVPLQIRAALTSETVLGRENLAGALALGMIVVVGVVMAIYALVQRRAARWQS